MVAPWKFPEELADWGFIYRNGRVLVLVAGGFETRLARYVFGAVTVPIAGVDIGSFPTGEVSSVRGFPLLSDNPRAVEILAAVTAGDYSWSIPPTPPPPRRTEYSASVFLPPTVNRSEIEQVTGATYDLPEAPDSLVGEDRVVYVWFRTLPPDLLPDPETELGRGLAVDTQRWGGVSSWELISNHPQSLGWAIRDLAQVHDLAIITVEDLYRDRATVLRHAERYRGWSVDWEGRDELADNPKPERPRPPAPPRGPSWTMTTTLDEWAVVYDDGAIYTVRAESMQPDGDIYRFLATTEEVGTVTMGWATAAGAKIVIQGTPDLADNPEAAAIVEQLTAELQSTNPNPTR